MGVNRIHGNSVGWDEADAWAAENRDALRKQHANLVAQVRRLERDDGPDPVVSRLVAIVSDLMAGGSTEQVVRAALLMETLVPFVARHPCIYSTFGGVFSQAQYFADSHMARDHPGYVVRR